MCRTTSLVSPLSAQAGFHLRGAAPSHVQLPIGASLVSSDASSGASWTPAFRGGFERIVWSLQTQPCQNAPNSAASRLRIDADK